MFSTLTCVQLEHSAALQQMRNDYLHTLIAPMDGMWESAVISQATFWEIQDRGQRAGYFCINSENDLLRFSLLAEYQVQAQAIFRRVISTYGIQHAIASTIEPFYFSLCLDIQAHMTLHSYLFHDHKRVELSAEHGRNLIRKASKEEFVPLLHFYQANTAGPGAWIAPFLRTRLACEELFVLYDQQTVVATGECIPSQTQTPYADLGMVVAQAYRGQGFGSSVLIQLKNHCYATGWKPICSCAADNYASKKAIEKAGFLSEQRMVEITFSMSQP